MKKFFCFFALLTFTLSFSSPEVKIDTVKKALFTATSDTLALKIITPKTEPVDTSSPWKVALAIGVGTLIVNILVSWLTRRSATKALEKQLTSNKDILEKQLEYNRDALTKQLETTKEIALQQIANAQKTSERDFNKTVLSGNRQAWINDLRDNISRVITYSWVLATGHMKDDEFKEMQRLVNKIELMLNPEDDKDFILSLSQLFECSALVFTKKSDTAELRKLVDRVKVYAQTTLKTEWKRVKRGE